MKLSIGEIENIIHVMSLSPPSFVDLIHNEGIRDYFPKDYFPKIFVDADDIYIINERVATVKDPYSEDPLIVRNSYPVFLVIDEDGDIIHNNTLDGRILLQPEYKLLSCTLYPPFNTPSLDLNYYIKLDHIELEKYYHSVPTSTTEIPFTLQFVNGPIYETTRNGGLSMKAHMEIEDTMKLCPKYFYK